MAFGIHRVAKAKAGDLYGLELEANRTEEDKRNFPNSNIDWERTKDNYYFVKTSDWKNSIPRIVTDFGITKTIRKDAVLMIDGFYSASPEWFEGKTPEEIKEYFSKCVDFHRAHYGVVINAVVHMDEATPHMAVASIPLVKNKDNSYSLSAKTLLGGRVDFHGRQDDFYKEVSKGYGLERGEVSTPEAKREHLDVMDYKLKMRTAEIQAAEADKVDLEAKCNELEKRIGTLEQIGEIIDTITGKIEKVFEHVKDAFRNGLEKLLTLIERREPVRDIDLKQAACSMARCGRYTDNDTGEVTPLYYPKLDRETPVSWNGTKPVFVNTDGEYYGVFKRIGDEITRCPPDEWEKTFTPGTRDEMPEREDIEQEPIEQGLTEIKYILDGEPEALDNLDEWEQPEEINFDDVEAHTGRDNPDEDEGDDFDPVCI